MKTLEVARLAADRQVETPLQMALNMTYITLCFLFALVMTPVIIPLSIIFRLYRENLHHKIKEETQGDVIIATGDDAVWFQDTPKNTAVINSILFLRGKLDISKFRDVCLNKIVNARDDSGELMGVKFSCYATKMYHRDVWLKDRNFDIKKHVFMWEGEVPRTKAELEILCGNLCSKELPKDRSPWQMIGIPCFTGDTAGRAEGDEPGEMFPMIFRVHHSIGDGISLMRLLMQQLFDVGPQTREQLPKKFGSKGIAMRLLKAVFTGPSMVMGRLFWPADGHLLHGPELTGHKLFTWAENMDLDLIKRMKTASGTTVNDILMTCLAGGFYEYFSKFASDIPSDILTYVPVDIRSPNAKLVLDNQFALVFLKLPVNVKDRMERLAETKARMEAIKTSAEPLVNALTIRYLMGRFPNWLTHIIFDRVASKCSLVLSNVPGPKQACYVCGLKLEQLIFWPPQRCNVGIGISILSYNGTVKTGLMIDKRLCSNPQRLLVEFEKEVKAMATYLNVLDGEGDGEKVEAKEGEKGEVEGARDDNKVVMEVEERVEGAKEEKVVKEEGAKEEKVAKKEVEERVEGAKEEKVVKEEGVKEENVAKKKVEERAEGAKEEKVANEEGVKEEKVAKEEGAKEEKVAKEEGVKEENVAKKEVEERVEGAKEEKVVKEEGVKEEKVAKEEGAKEEKVAKEEGVKEENVAKKEVEERVEGAKEEKVVKEEGVKEEKVAKEEGVKEEKVAKKEVEERVEGVKEEKVAKEEGVKEEKVAKKEVEERVEGLKEEKVVKEEVEERMKERKEVEKEEKVAMEGEKVVKEEEEKERMGNKEEEEMVKEGKMAMELVEESKEEGKEKKEDTKLES